MALPRCDTWPHAVKTPIRVAVEPAFDAHVIAELRARGHDVIIEEGHGVFAFGGAQLILRDGEHYTAGSDPRKDGQAVGY